MATVGQWLAGARPRTLSAAVAPVAAGTGAAAAADSFIASRALLALLVAVALQVGVNYANDYSDGIRGTDDERVGPVRLVGQRLAEPMHVKAAALASLAVAALAGVLLVALTGQWWLLAVGAVSMAAAWLYTGGPRPYGYLGLGEVFVFVFFGPVAVIGTTYVQVESITALAVGASIPIGLLACLILIANNLRDIPTDRESGKQTLAVRLGDVRTRSMFTAGAVLTYVVTLALVPLSAGALAGLVGALPAAAAVRDVRSGAVGPALIPVLVRTGVALLLTGLGLGLGFFVVAAL